MTTTTLILECLLVVSNVWWGVVWAYLRIDRDAYKVALDDAVADYRAASKAQHTAEDRLLSVRRDLGDDVYRELMRRAA